MQTMGETCERSVADNVGGPLSADSGVECDNVVKKQWG